MIGTIEIFGTTDVGQVRDHNEDNFVICKDLEQKAWNFKRDEKLSLAREGALLVVADGMGGANAGEVASHLAQETVKDAFEKLDKIPEGDKEKEQLLKGIIKKAHDDIVSHQQENLETAGMGTTLVIAWVIGEKLHVGWSGDSRCYIFHGQENLLPFTEDHSLVWSLVQQGEISPEEAREHPESNIITQSLGDPSNPPKPSAKTTKLYKGDKVMVCSDGLNGMLSDEQIRHYLAADKAVAVICKEVTQAANQAGGTDNITTLMLEVLEGDERPADARVPTAGAIAGDKNKSDNRPTTTQVLRSKISTKNYLLVGAGIILIGLLLWILFLQSGGNGSNKQTIININEKSYEYTSGKAQDLDLVALITGENMNIDSFFVDGLDYINNGDKGNIRFLIEGEQDHKVKVKLFPQSKDTVFIADLTFRAKVPPPAMPKPRVPANSKPGENAREETVMPGEPTENQPHPKPVDTIAGEIKVEPVAPAPGDTTETKQTEPSDTVGKQKPGPPTLNPIKEEPDTNGQQ